jgi:hypothetical protein
MTDASMLEQALDQLVARLEDGAAPGCSAVLYGSAARGDWDARRSDVNLLLVLEDASPAGLERLTPLIVDWHEPGWTPPLLTGRDEWTRAVDVFPIEITDMRLAYRVLTGPDPIAELRVDPADLRRALEQAFRGKLVHLRQAYARFSGAMPTLGGFASSSISEVLVLLRSTAVLLGREPGRRAEQVIDLLRAELGPGVDALREITARRRDHEWSCSPELFAGYLGAIEHAVETVDSFQSGGA